MVFCSRSPGVVGAEANVSVGGQMEDEVVPGDRRAQAALVEHIAFDQGKALLPARRGDELALSCGEVVVNRHLVTVGQ